jgi:MFS family permease
VAARVPRAGQDLGNTRRFALTLPVRGSFLRPARLGEGSGQREERRACEAKPTGEEVYAVTDPQQGRVGLEIVGRLELPLVPRDLLSSVTQPANVSPRRPRQSGAADSPVRALVAAFTDTYRLLLDPIDTRLWMKLSVLCLFLGGGATSAAFHWALSALPGEVADANFMTHLRVFLARHPTLLLLATAVAVALGVTLVYFRALFRFALVDSILRREAHLRRAMRELRPVAGSYFRWLLGALIVMGAILAVGALLALPSLRAAGRQSLTPSILLVAVLLGEALFGLLAALGITLTDDLVVPIIYAERLTVLPAWRRLLEELRAEAGAFTLYILLRFVVSVGVGIAVLFFLFPALVALFSGAIIVAVAVVMALQLVGLTWAWTPFTVVVAGGALLLLMILLLMLMGVAGMPGQVFLQTFGLRFMAPRVPALAELWQAQTPQDQPE